MEHERELEHEREREQEREQELLAIENTLKDMLKVQLGVNETTGRIDENRKTSKTLSRRDKLELDKITADEDTLAGRCGSVVEALRDENIPVFAWVTEQVADGMEDVHERLAAEDTGVMTQQTEGNVVRTLEALIKSLEQERRKQEEQKQAGGGGGGGGGKKKKRLIPPLAELKMVRTMHAQAADETAQLEILSRMGMVKKEQAGESLKKLSEREAHIGRLLKDLLEALKPEAQEE